MSVTIEPRTMALTEVEMFYTRAGEADPVVLLHGWPQSSAAWEDVTPRLAVDHTVIAPDLRGFGASSKPEHGYDTDRVARDVLELIDGLGFDRVCLAGHDWGGAVAYSLAAQFSDRVRRVAIFEMVLPGLGILEEAMVPKAGGQFLWHMGFHSVPNIPAILVDGREETYLNHFFDRDSHDPSAVTAERRSRYKGAMQAPGALQASLGLYRDVFESARQNQVHRRQRLKMPVLALGGEACLGPLTKQCLEMVADDVRGGVIPACGHWVCDECPSVVADQLLAFFGEESTGVA